MSLPVIERTNIAANFDGIILENSIAFANGWAFDLLDQNKKISILIKSEFGIIGEGETGLSRPDVQAAGSTSTNAGFRIRLKPRGNEKHIKIYIKQQDTLILLHTENFLNYLPASNLTREDIIVVFKILFHREPENEEAIIHQLTMHKTKKTFLKSMFSSPEFIEKNMDVIALLQKK
jgi:hypothetical protein